MFVSSKYLASQSLPSGNDGHNSLDRRVGSIKVINHFYLDRKLRNRLQQISTSMRGNTRKEGKEAEEKILMKINR